jgi:hypothetical protein
MIVALLSATACARGGLRESREGQSQTWRSWIGHNSHSSTGTGKKTPGEPGHTRDTHGTRERTRALGPHRRTSQPSIQNHQQRTTRTSARQRDPYATRDDRNRGRLSLSRQPQVRSRPLPAADSEEAAPSEPNPASTRSQSASPVKRHRPAGREPRERDYIKLHLVQTRNRNTGERTRCR